jgi:salicylate hydroxylase
MEVLIAGGGIGGLAAALACTRAGCDVRLFEQAPAFAEVGAGIQLGPNATRLFDRWGLQAELARVAAMPQQLSVRRAGDGCELARLRLGADLAERYGAPYVTVHRADLQKILIEAVRAAGAAPALSSRVAGVQALGDAVRVRLETGKDVEGDVLVGADGLWSAVRAQVFADGPPRPTGHVAYRAVAAQSSIPKSLRNPDVTLWLGRRTHVVAYPVRGGEQLNVVAIVHAKSLGAAQDWDQPARAEDLLEAMGPSCNALRELIGAMPAWRLWTLHDRKPLRAAGEMARGRIALLGDAAHPMRPYLAQGAGMAIEDADELARVLAMARDAAIEAPLALKRFALNRWERCARVQAQARRNGRIFHAAGVMRWGRDLSLRLLGERLLDQPWLYRSRS